MIRKPKETSCRQFTDEAGNVVKNNPPEVAKEDLLGEQVTTGKMLRDGIEKARIERKRLR